jgi:hypothetical protein
MVVASNMLRSNTGNTIFVFGSNLAGRHGRGSALEARRKHGAVYGVGVGRTGDSYAIPTKGHRLEVLPLSVIQEHINTFEEYVKNHPDLLFEVVAIGCGLAGYTHAQMSPLFINLRNYNNVILPDEWYD